MLSFGCGFFSSLDYLSRHGLARSRDNPRLAGFEELPGCCADKLHHLTSPSARLEGPAPHLLSFSIIALCVGVEWCLGVYLLSTLTGTLRASGPLQETQRETLLILLSSDR